MALLDQTKKGWLNRYYPKNATSQSCYCGCTKPLSKQFFEDWTGKKFLNKTHFNRTKAFRNPKVFEIQKQIDCHNKNQLVTSNQKGR